MDVAAGCMTNAAKAANVPHDCPRDKPCKRMLR